MGASACKTHVLETLLVAVFILPVQEGQEASHGTFFYQNMRARHAPSHVQTETHSKMTLESRTSKPYYNYNTRQKRRNPLKSQNPLEKNRTTPAPSPFFSKGKKLESMAFVF